MVGSASFHLSGDKNGVIVGSIVKLSCGLPKETEINEPEVLRLVEFL
jgi:hypothetical protein